MKSMQSSHAVGMHVVDGFLIAPAPDGLDDALLLRFRSELLKKAHAALIRGALIDVSRIQVLDSVTFSFLSDTAKMLALLGAATVFVGFQPGVVAALVDLDLEEVDIRGVATLEDGFELLRELQAAKISAPALEPEQEPSNEPEDDDPERDDVAAL
jgi:rsbT antagonist protein RsbS